MRKLRLEALAINAETRCKARTLHDQDLWFLARTEPNVNLTGPGQLNAVKMPHHESFTVLIIVGCAGKFPGNPKS